VGGLLAYFGQNVLPLGQRLWALPLHMLSD